MATSLVAGGGHDPAGSETSNDHRPAPQPGVVEPLDLDEERIHVHVQDGLGETLHAATVPPAPHDLIH